MSVHKPPDRAGGNCSSPLLQFMPEAGRRGSGTSGPRVLRAPYVLTPLTARLTPSLLVGRRPRRSRDSPCATESSLRVLRCYAVGPVTDEPFPLAIPCRRREPANGTGRNAARTDRSDRVGAASEKRSPKRFGRLPFENRSTCSADIGPRIVPRWRAHFHFAPLRVWFAQWRRGGCPRSGLPHAPRYLFRRSQVGVRNFDMLPGPGNLAFVPLQ